MNTLDLKNLEKKAFRSVHQDGLWDISIGGIVFSMSLLEYSNESDAFPILRFGLVLLGLVISELILWGGKKFLTIPRMGQVKFGPQRQKRNRVMIAILAVIVMIQVAVVIGTALLLKNPQWATSLGFSGTDQDRERLLVSMIGALFVGPSTALIAYFTDFMRGYYIAVLLAFAVFSMIWFAQPVFMTASAALIIIPGIVLFVRFLRRYPLPPAEASRD